MKQFTVRIENNTTGTIYSGDIESLIGKKVVIHLTDENGNPVETRGNLVEVLEEIEYFDE